VGVRIVRFTVLGDVAVESGGVRLDPASPKARLLLAVLLCRPGEAVPFAELVDAIWPDHPPRSAQNNLRSYVYQLRTVLGRDLIVRRGGSYCLAIDPRSVDARVFADHVARGDAELRRGDPVAARAAFRAGLALWRGAPFAGLRDEPWLATEAARLMEQRLSAHERCFELELDLVDPAVILAELTALVAEQPYRERLHSQLMQALYRAGRRADALRVYRELSEALTTELGIEPGREIVEVHRTILHDETGYATGDEPAPESVPTPPTVLPAQLPPVPRHFSGTARWARPRRPPTG
jgi:DNA-binding SARP family transcriptional activator